MIIITIDHEIYPYTQELTLTFIKNVFNKKKFGKKKKVTKRKRKHTHKHKHIDIGDFSTCPGGQLKDTF